MFARPEINFERTPVTLILAALIAALAVVCQLDPERYEHYYTGLRLGMSPEIWQGEVWRPFTTTLLHGGFLHALFNIYWLLVFGPLVEGRLGSYKTLALIVLFAVVASMAQYVGVYYLYRGTWELAQAANIPFLDRYLDVQMRLTGTGLVGLSGVNYGLFGLAWAGSRRDAQFAAVCNRDTVRLMVAWLIVCVVLTTIGAMHVANAAHTAGLVMGLLVGQAVFARRRRGWWLAGAALCTLLALAGLLGAPGHPRYEYQHEEEQQSAVDYTGNQRDK
ncbi:MAG: rhomboid family intramembrane serine protease [Pirellulales bacterium]